MDKLAAKKEAAVSVETTVKEVFQKVLDVEPSEIKPDETLDASLGVDSTEMVEISVGLKKTLNIDIADNELRKSHTFNQIVEILSAKVPA